MNQGTKISTQNLLSLPLRLCSLATVWIIATVQNKVTNIHFAAATQAIIKFHFDNLEINSLSTKNKSISRIQLGKTQDSDIMFLDVSFVSI